jgi:hypothetical protein
MTEKKGFLQTVPGVIAGIATILTAVVALVSLFNGGDSAPEPDASQTASPTPSETETTSGPSSTSTGGSSIAPRAVIAPKVVEFGNVGTGRTGTQTVTVANSGNEYLVVESAEITGRDDVFSVSAEQCLEETGIEPDGECEMRVTFNPTTAGSYAGFLQIEHSASGSPERVALNGEAALLGL